MKKMRITGKSKDGKMLDHVRDVLQFLGFNVEDEGIPHFPNVFLVGIYQDGRLHVDQKYDNVDWPKARQAMIFVYVEANNSWTIRHISENYEIHKQYIGRKNFRICISDWDKRELFVYKGIDWYDRRYLDYNNFRNEIKGAWSEYRDFLEGKKSTKWRLLSP
ncbi:MAG: hypothetical protein HXO20_04930 [Prevotella shahii]|jgi:hypothetical protein|nr:hypothetical protein [Hoylesella shahii]DAW73143.1 MAG TPA: hypothetical protein [Caudoviricetes sp.]